MTDGGDCDESSTDINPDGTESCDGVDEDCDDLTDEGLDTTTYYKDADGDTYGEDGSDTKMCSDPGTGYATIDGDCDDTLEDVNPDGTESCDGTDEDCDTSIDEDLATTTYYEDTDGDLYGDDATAMDACSDPGGTYVSDGGDCDESSTEVNPGAAEVCNDWIDNDCDETDNGCTPSGEFSASSADALIYAEAASSDGELGYSVFAGDDYTGDGIDDLLLGAPWDDAGGTEAGATYVFSDPSGSLTTADADAFLGPPGASELAGRGGAIGDLDADGWDDAIVGAYGSNTVYIFNGATGSTDPADSVVITHTGSVNFGIAVAAGDLDGDGQDDLVVGATTHDSSSLNDVGAAYVFYGPLTGTLDESDADAVLEGTGGGDQAGGMLAFVGDVVGAGLDTLAIGARYNDDGGSDAGAVYLVTGILSGEVALSSVDAVLTGAAADDNSWDAHGIGDVNADGTDDIVVGAFKYDTTDNNVGGAFILYGPVTSGSLSASDHILYGESNGNGMGLALDSAGDFNGDGEVDLLTGAYGNDDASTDAGSAYVFFGPLTSHVDASDADLKITGETSSGQLGWSVAGNFDSNGDGYDDVIVCARKENSAATDGGACYVFHGGGI